jgi:hypothetical protein
VQALRRLHPRVLAGALVALAVAVVYLRNRGGGGGGGGGGPLIDPLAPVTGDFGGSLDPSLVDTSAGGPAQPITIPLPAEGGIIWLPGEDPIVINPQHDPTTPPTTPTVKPLFHFGRYWRPGQIEAFRRLWAQRWRQHHPKASSKQVQTAWVAFLAGHPGIAAYFGLREQPATTARAAMAANGATAPAPQPSTGALVAPASSAPVAGVSV